MNHSSAIWQKAIIPANATILEAIQNLDQVAIKIVMVTNEAGMLQGTIADGDIRRGLLKGLDLNSPISKIIHHNPLIVPPEINLEQVKQLMVSNKIQQIPVVDEENRIVGLHLWDTIIDSHVRSNLMVIMAGGMGTRLRPHTENCPKPMLPLAGKPILEHIIEKAKLNGFRHFVLAINYLGHMIEDYFCNGDLFGVQIEYLREASPLGTAGALALMNPLPDAPFVVTNGDVITDINYGVFLDFHYRFSALATMAIRNHEWQNPYGVVQTKGLDIIGFEEKPIYRSQINAGVYALDPSTLSLIRPNTPCHMPTLFEFLHSKKLRTIAYPIHEPWLDVGRPDDLEQASKLNFKLGIK